MGDPPIFSDIQVHYVKKQDVRDLGNGKLQAHTCLLNQRLKSEAMGGTIEFDKVPPDVG